MHEYTTIFRLTTNYQCSERRRGYHDGSCKIWHIFDDNLWSFFLSKFLNHSALVRYRSFLTGLMGNELKTNCILCHFVIFCTVINTFLARFSIALTRRSGQGWPPHQWVNDNAGGEEDDHDHVGLDGLVLCKDWMSCLSSRPDVRLDSCWLSGYVWLDQVGQVGWVLLLLLLWLEKISRQRPKVTYLHCQPHQPSCKQKMGRASSLCTDFLT